jgi:enoyl-CoA hydratase/carnithine racemase
MLGNMKPILRSTEILVTLTWSDVNAAVLELDDPLTFNAMTPGLLQSIGICLSAALAFRNLQALVLQATGPHFCTGG